MSWTRKLVAAMCVVGLSLQCTQTTERPACSEMTLAAMQAEFSAELIEACEGKELDDCEEADAIIEAQDERLKEWVLCQ